MRRADAEALALGLIHGPVEMVPVSSSGHVAALPWLLGWEVAGWEGARRKELEVALHTARRPRCCC
jgi:undecaprenyl-diphosphatase